jgi:hypothetical protein
MRTSGLRLAVLAMVCTFAAQAAASPPAPPHAASASLVFLAAQAPAAAPADKPFGKEQLDQMTAPIALYPDALLAQVLMASTYPGDVADAARWSKANTSAKGEDAVRQVASQPWDPSVQSLVAFPQVLETLSKDAGWVQKLGDAFLAQPEDVMASVQRLRHQAQAAGNLKTTPEQVVKTEAGGVGGTTVVESPPDTIIIESADPQVVYVPSYDPSWVYGAWAYPSYPPYYYGYYPGAALFSFGVGLAIGGALWGDVNWGGGDIDIDINNEFNRNSNRERNVDRGNRGDGKWNHNSANRDGVPYRDNKSREQFGRQREGASQRDDYRGRDPGRDASRDRARQSMTDRGFDAPAASNREARDRAGQASRQMDRGQGSFNNAQARQGSRDSYNRGNARNDAFTGSRNPGQSRSSYNRGRSSYGASQRGGSRSAGRSMSRPARGGGGRRR